MTHDEKDRERGKRPRVHDDAMLKPQDARQRSKSDIGVLETASEHLDQFLIEHLRANPECTN